MDTEFFLLLFFFLASRISRGHQQSDVRVQLGNLADVNTSSMAGLMSGSDTEIWWPLLNSKEHPHAFMRYFVLGSEYSESSSTSAMDIRNASIANYKARKKVGGIGSIVISISMLAFGCVTSGVESSGCIGVVPMALGINSKGQHKMYSMWKSTSYDVVNTIAADLLDVPYHHNTNNGTNMLNVRSLSITKRTQFCEVDPHFDQVVVKPVVDAVYMILDGCYQVSNSSFWNITGSRNLLVLGFSNHSYWGYEFYNQTKHWLLSHKSLPMNQCSEAPLFAQNTDPHVYHACLPVKGCLVVEMGTSFGGISIDDMFTWFFVYLTNETKVQLPEYATATGFYARTGNKQNTSIFLSRSITGKCIMKVPGPMIFPNLVGVEEARIVDLSVLNMAMKTIRDSYIQGHKNLFDIENGPGSEMLTSTLVVVTSFLSVIYATIPFTNNVLRLIKYIVGHTPRRYRAAQFGLLAFFNCTVTAVTYIVGVFALAKDEIVKENKFDTWALVAQNVPLNLYGVRIQAVFIVQGRSTYHSFMLLLAWILGSISMPLVAGVTIHRCNAVFGAADDKRVPVSNMQITSSDEVRT